MTRPTPPPSGPSPAQHDPDAWIDEHRAAQFLSLNHRTLPRWRLRGTGPPLIRISSRCVRSRDRDLYAWVQARLRSSTSEG